MGSNSPRSEDSLLVIIMVLYKISLVIILALSHSANSAAAPSDKIQDAIDGNSKLLQLDSEHYCGLSAYDKILEKRWEEFVAANKIKSNATGYILGNEALKREWALIYRQSVPELFQAKNVVEPPKTVVQERLAQLKVTDMLVRLSVRYDSATAEDLRNFEGGAEKFVKHLIHSSQLYFEQPEIRSELRIVLVVVSLGQLSKSLEPSASSEDILVNYRSTNPDDFSDISVADVNVIILRRNIFQQLNTYGLEGLAFTGIFCNRFAGKIPTALIKAHNLNTGSVTLAHELAHTLNVQHDDEAIFGCPGDRFIMSPTSGPGKNTWSRCSLNQILGYITSDDIWECVIDNRRIESAKPVSKEFDFHPATRQPKLPGQLCPPKLQCEMAIEPGLHIVDLPAERSTKDKCEWLPCKYNQYEQFYFWTGPALPGSECSLGGRKGMCLLAKCDTTGNTPLT